MDFAPSARTQALIERLERFMHDEVQPAEGVYAAQLSGSRDHRQWRQPAVMETLKAKARAAGLWNLFLPDAEHGAGLGNLARRATHQVRRGPANAARTPG